MATRVDCYIMEAMQTATGVEFESELVARERLRIPARMKGGGIKRAADTKYPAILGAILDILPRVVEKKDKDGETVKGAYADHLTIVIGAGAFDEAGHINDQFLKATEVGPYPVAIQEAWMRMRAEAVTKYGIEEDEEDGEKLARLGPLADATPAMVRNRGAEERRKGGRT